ncbi:MAG: hypothetical protein CMH49_09495 [Myxococcales bacterium]|nr:hypothetical protein [Myxococcales bacterium]
MSKVSALKYVLGCSVNPFTTHCLLGYIILVFSLGIEVQAQPKNLPKSESQMGKENSDKRIKRPVRRSVEKRKQSLVERERKLKEYIRSGDDSISIYHVMAELLDEMMADVQKLRISQVSPLAIRGVAVSPNLSPLFSQFIEGAITSRFSQSSDIKLRYCASCQSLRTQVEGEEWVLKLGWTSQKDMENTAQVLGVNSFLDAHISYIPAANQVMLSVKIFSVSDGTILWAETYSSDETTAAILRSGERVVTREEAYRELIRKIEARPYYGYQLYFGGGMIPFEGPLGDINFITLGIKFYEKFGQNKRNQFGIFGESALNVFTNPLLGAFFGGMYQRQINTPNLNDIQFWGGGAMSFFVAGIQGNTLSFESMFDVIMQFRLGLGLSIYYAIPVAFGAYDVGGLGYKFRFTFNF